MTARQLGLAAAGGSAALLLGALFFQYVMGLAPCDLCIWQRWPHLAAVGLGAVVLWAPVAAVLWAGAAAAGVAAGIAIYHTGVEQALWTGPAGCAGPAGDIAGLSPQQFLDMLNTAEVVPCDEVAWELLGISMAGWNALASLALAGLWLWAARSARAETAASRP